MIEPLKLDVFSSFFSSLFLRGDASGLATLGEQSYLFFWPSLNHIPVNPML
jgi:hypothetical protein